MGSGFTFEMALAGATLVAAYALIFSEALHRSSVALVGAVVMIGVGTAAGFYDQEAAVRAIDGNTLFLLTAMMGLITLLRPTGGFEYVAIRIAKLSADSPRRLLIYLSFAVSVISMFLDNVTTVLIFAPITVLITRMLALNPMPYLMAEAMLSNVGGIATLVGDPPNIMIGSAAGLNFNQFLIHLGPVVAVVWLGTVALVLMLFRHDLRPTAHIHVDLDEHRAIRNPAALRRALAALLLVVALFFVHHHLGLYPAYVAFIGLALALTLLRPDPEALFGKLEWSVLIFFTGLFVIVGGVEASGLLALLGHQLAVMAHDPEKLLLTALTLMWVAAIVSAVVDNIPFTVTMIPIIQALEGQGIPVMPLWWALALGVGLGGNGSHIGATANIIAMTESERAGIPEARITPGAWLRRGIPTMLVSMSLASILFAFFFDWFR